MDAVLPWPSETFMDLTFIRCPRAHSIRARKSCKSSNPDARSNLETFVTNGEGGREGDGLLILDVTARTARGRRTDRERHDAARGCAYLPRVRTYTDDIYGTREWKRMLRILGCTLDNRAPVRTEPVDKPPGKTATARGRNATVRLCAWRAERSADSPRFCALA